MYHFITKWGGRCKGAAPRRGSPAHGVPPERVELIARELMAAMDGLQLRWLRSLDSMDFVAEWERFADRLLD